jgi:excisionase family DNA binding protein
MTELLTVREAAERLKVQPKTVREWLKRGRLHGAKAGKSWRVPAEALAEVLKPPMRIVKDGEAAEEATLGAINTALADTDRQRRDAMGPLVEAVNYATGDVVTCDTAEDLGAVLLALVQALFPLDTPVYPRTFYGLTTFPLSLVNTVLERYGYVLHATKTRVATRFVACLDTHGRTEPYGLFELRRVEAAER